MQYKLDWQNLLSSKRPPAESGGSFEEDKHLEFRTAFEADCDRVIFSTPFRRMGRKTQVHPKSSHDHIHNRLTHSLEVASVGRTLGSKLSAFLIERGELPANRKKADIASIAEAACLAHDLGNPPFGHAGEEAIRHWVKGDGLGLIEDLDISDESKADWNLFEGNAQSFRLGARTDISNIGYIRLTSASLGAMVKYPWFSQDQNAIKTKKFNFFHSEKQIAEAVWNELGLSLSGSFVRHPMSFLTEAADDICYRIVDLEDAVELHILDEKRVRTIFSNLANIPVDHNKSLGSLRGLAIRNLLDEFWKVFENDYEQIMNGERVCDLKENLVGSIVTSLQEIKEIYEIIFSDRDKVAMELGAYKVLGKISKAALNGCLEIQDMHKNNAKISFISKRCFELFWGSDFVEKNLNEKNVVWWTEQCRDYISSMTDNYAHQVAAEIEGVY